MNVLSLFDGMSCGRIALERAGIKVDEYYASELDKYAIQVSRANYPDIVQLGDVRGVDGSGLPKIDLLIGGSPCQGFSFAGKQLNFDDPRSKLFFEYVRLLKECRPKYFLLENVRMKKESQDVISEALGVEPIAINSNLVSAQNRHRLYWTNIPFDRTIEDKGLIIADILEEDVSEEFYYKEKSIAYMMRGNDKWMQAGDCRAKRYAMYKDKKSFTLTANMHKGVPYNFFSNIDSIEMGKAELNGHDILKRLYSANAKSPTLTAVCGGNQEKKIAVDDIEWRKLTPMECERLQTIPDNYSDCVSNSQRYKMIGNGWTVDVIAHIFKGLKNVKTV
jgi:DNA-cytosine methyltransferase